MMLFEGGINRLNQFRMNDLELMQALAGTDVRDVSPQDLRDGLREQRDPVQDLERRARELERQLAADPRTADEVAAMRDRYGDIPTPDDVLLPEVSRHVVDLPDLPRHARIHPVDGADNTFQVSFRGRVDARR
ncbi:hypothetical protein [Micromonospora zhanjiangensis]